ncbi:family 78 glycoside hydrolase catalytic domain [Flavitalea sp. BT771]|uniref:alpha-L-rhamnosidase n=1 Tax=Flavitalea sp. BT771 TaxID=3063329 RepID=UPI0026E3903C|nr:alpha-L-rhamnosidase [Flavitalea sp. BT771]MDO6435187.1 family 78 glycoside hydrolase catalytic domain [Flavitalea sp. BT771]MDV6224108.1 family 78 glycoside hydrolase catalytic domain [Flavitalea sp. BT771]
MMRTIFLFTLGNLLSSLAPAATPPCQPVFLRCEYLQQPLGIDAPHPRLSWQLEDHRPGALQKAYVVTVGTDSLALAGGATGSWSTGRRDSPDQLTSYEGPALQPFTRYYWRVDIWGKDGVRAAGPIASFETGMMDAASWKGAWISDSRDRDLRRAPYFRKGFVTTKKIRSARAYIAAAGLYELYINGKKIGDHRLDPMYTRFDRRNLYVTYDVTGNIQSGDNVVGVLLGNGWYNHQSTAVWYFHEAPWRSRPSFCLDIRVTYEDGSMETISSDRGWKTALSPIVLNSIYTGEHVDDRLEQAGWNNTGFADSAWKEVIYRPVPSSNVVSQSMHPIRQVEEIRPVSVKHPGDSVWVFDLGRNIAGVSRLQVHGPAGTKLVLKHGERLYPNGRVDQSNISVHYRPTDDTDPFGTDIYTLNGKGEEEFMPRFNYKGFQYVEIITAPGIQLTKESLTAYFMHSDVPPVGRISSSNPVLDKIWKATNNSYLSNLFGYPTDCPQREKNGWTGDAHIASETGLYNFDGITIYEKWLADHRDEQQPNGVLPSIIPTGGWGYEWGNGPDWTSTIAIIPWNIYLFYGDKKLLTDCYDNIRRYVDHITDISPSGLTTWGLGDWIPVSTKPPVIFTSSVYYYVDASILARAAALLGKSEDQAKYTALAEKIKTAFNEKFLVPATGSYGQGMQTELAMPLYWGLVPEDMKNKVAGNLAAKVAADGNHLNVGLLGTKALLGALSENGYADVAYRIASSETFPSWGWWIVNGATTLYENWPIDAKSDISLNHIMFGEIGAWMYKGLAGILPDPAQPGFKHVLLRPHFVKGLDRFEASHECPYGTISSSWKREGSVIVYKAVIPPNTSATLQLPGQAAIPGVQPGQPAQVIELGAGEYTYKVKVQ